MNDLDLVRELQADVPVPAQERLAAGRAQLLAAISRPPRQSRFRSPAVVLAAGAAAAVVAAAALSVTSGSAAPARALTVAELSYRAAAAAARQPDLRPGQWVYRKWTDENPGSHPLFNTAESWTTADRSKYAIFDHGKLRVFRIPPLPVPGLHLSIPYRSIGSLPADPRALVTWLDHYGCTGPPPPPGITGRWHGCLTDAFFLIENAIGAYVMPPRFTAELYRALTDIPGVTVDNNAVNVAGQRGIGFRLRGSLQRSPFFMEIILSRRTYAYIGSSMLSATEHGVVIQNHGAAVVRQALVSGPGVRP